MTRIVVRGTPAPQGSKRFMGTTPSGHAKMIEHSKRVKPWREAVRSAAVEQITFMDGLLPGYPLDEPLQALIVFTFARPKSHYRTGRNAHLLRDNAPMAPAGKPDLSKLVRSTEDALTDAGVWRDDALVVTLMTRKVYAGPPDAAADPLRLAAPGAVIEIWTANADYPETTDTTKPRNLPNNRSSAET